MAVYPSSRTETERVIAAARVGVVLCAQVAMQLNPIALGRLGPLVTTLNSIYLSWAIAVAAFTWTWTWSGSNWLTYGTHVLDVAVFAGLESLVPEPYSLFFIYAVFVMFCGALRWGWRGTISTSAAVAMVYIVVLLMSTARGVTDFEPTRLFMRVAYFVVAGALLAYLSHHEESLRQEIDQLARWPVATGTDEEQILRPILEHGASTLAAQHALVLWEIDEEPGLSLAAWSPGSFSLMRRPPFELAPTVAEGLENATFLCTGRLNAQVVSVVQGSDGRFSRRVGFPLHRDLRQFVGKVGLVSAPFQTVRVSGRVVFSALGTRSAEIVPLTEIVAREIGLSLDQKVVAQRLQEVAVREERVRLARDLHDGVLQSLTGVRLELQALANSGTPSGPPLSRERLIELERALAVEQGELRMFIDGTKPTTAVAVDESFVASLETIRARLSTQWQTPVQLRVSPESRECPPELKQAVPLMVHEAVVNALRHAKPTKVNVVLNRAADGLHIIVSDDGRGFPFKGRYDHGALVQSGVAPHSLFERVVTLGGKMLISSSDRGSRVEMVLAC